MYTPIVGFKMTKVLDSGIVFKKLIMYLFKNLFHRIFQAYELLPYWSRVGDWPHKIPVEISHQQGIIG